MEDEQHSKLTSDCHLVPWHVCDTFSLIHIETLHKEPLGRNKTDASRERSQGTAPPLAVG